MASQTKTWWLCWCALALVLVGVGVGVGGAAPAEAQAASFYVIHPGGEGDADTARPYLESLFEYLEKSTGVAVSGTYLNDEQEGLKAWTDGEPDIAILTPGFYAKHLKVEAPEPWLVTIPIYASGPYEKLYILSHLDTDLVALPGRKEAVKLLSSRSYDQAFLTDQLFVQAPNFAKIAWQSHAVSDLLGTLKSLSAGPSQGFVLLTGYEYGVVKDLIRHQEEYKGLKLVFTSPELPSSVVVVSAKSRLSADQRDKLKTALMGMSSTLTGKLILKNLRLKGFADSAAAAKTSHFSPSH